MTLPDWYNVALITGAGRGLGAAIAKSLAKDSRILVTDIDLSRASAIARAIENSGGEAVAQQLNVTERADFEKALLTAREKWGGVGVLVNNAAITKTTPLFDISAEEFSEVININMGGVFAGCQILGAAFRDQKYGRIINMASLAAQNGGAATGAHYAASKGGIVTLTKVFARDLAIHGVTVNAISPGPLDVELLPEILSPEKLDGLKKMVPVGHLGDPEFIAQIVCLLASPSASSITGATIDANGGLYVR